MELVVGEVFRNAARAVPERTALVDGARSMSFAELDRAGDQVAQRIADSGTRLGDRIVVWGGSPFELGPLQLGIARAGAVFAPLNARFGPREAAEVAEVASPRLVLLDDAHKEVCGELLDALGETAWMTLADVGIPGLGGSVGAGARVSGGPPSVEGLEGSSDHTVFFTSGSTGKPKAVVVSHRATVMRCHPGAQVEPRGTLVCPFPLFHMAAWTLAFQQWFARDGIIFTQGATGEEICRAIDESRAERTYLIPAMWRRVLDHLDSPEGRGYDLSSLRFADTGTSATPPSLLAEIGRRFPGATRRVFYGSTEAANVTSLDEHDMSRKAGSCGVPSPLVEARVSSEGELQVRSPLMFDRYLDDEEATAAAFDGDRWYKTGDRAEIDPEGFVFITGRMGHLIRTGGEGVDPQEVEAVLATHPSIEDVAVVGIQDPDWGEVVCAVVVPTEGAELPSVGELRAHCQGVLADFKHPRRVEETESIPRTEATMQVQRSLLVEQLVSRARLS